MNEFERELAYVKKTINSVITPDDLNAAKRLKTSFFDKYIVKVSPTDKTWIQTMDELNELEREKTRHITSAYLFGKN
jgi:uncharacterized protein (DUF39 family)